MEQVMDIPALEAFVVREFPQLDSGFAIEALTDRVGIEYHVLSGRAKDMASAAVTLSLVILALVWLAAMYEKIMTLL